MNFPEKNIESTCNNCRNKDTQICKEWLKQGRRYLAKHGKPRQKKYCKFWAYTSDRRKV